MHSTPLWDSSKLAMKAFLSLLLTSLILASFLAPTYSKKPTKNVLSVSDQKEWKKILRTHTNILALFSSGDKSISDIFPMFDKVASRVRGKGTLVQVDCTTKDGKKLCKNLKIKPDPYSLKHYKEGVYTKDYDRLMQDKSLYAFMENPTSDPPWSEDPMAGDVRHIEEAKEFENLLRKEKKPILTMFYAPWCGHCKRMKPEFATAAAQVKGQVVLAGMDVDKPDAYGLRQELNISGFPTIIYFENGQRKLDYSGGRDADGIVDWLRDPQAPPAEPEATEEEQPWSEVEPNVEHLSTENFDTFMSEHSSVLVMFYAPWCGHCKAMKPKYAEAAVLLKEQGIEGILAAVDATKDKELGDRFEVKGYPTLKYFSDGQLQYDYGYKREAQDFVDFMIEPKEPPPPEKDWTEMDTEVLHLTDEDFKSTLKKKKHALVMFYAPWCGHCKKAKPEYMAAAEQFASDKKTAFAAVDCTKYRSVCEMYDVKGYPTIKYFNFGKKASPYNGGRDENGFATFMADPSSFIRDEL